MNAKKHKDRKSRAGYIRQEETVEKQTTDGDKKAEA